MKFKKWMALLGLTMTLAACGDKQVTYMSEQELSADVLQKFFSDLPKVNGQLELKDMKIGMPFREVMKLLSLEPSGCCMGGKTVHFTKYLPETGDIVSFAPEEIPLAADFVPGTGGAPLDISSVPDTASIALKGRISIFGDNTEFLAVFPQGKLAMVEIKRIQKGQMDESATHVVVDSFAKKFGTEPKLLKYQQAVLKQSCDDVANASPGSAADKEALEVAAKHCSESFQYLAGFKDSDAVLVISGGRASAPGTGIIRNIETVHLQRLDWFDTQASIAKAKASDAQKMEQEATEKRNSDL